MAGPLSAGSIVLDTSKLDQLAKHLKPAAAAIVAKAAHDVEGHAKAGAPVDTGNLRNSIAAHQADELTWRVDVAADYGAYVEFGTHKSAAQPYLGPAVEAVRGGLARAWKALFE